MTKLIRNATLSFVLLSIVAFTLLGSLYMWDTQSIVDAIGVENAYLVMFFVALLGGVSTVGGVAYFAAIIALASGGAEPLLLALTSGAGVTVADSLYFYLGKHGHAHVSKGFVHSRIECAIGLLDRLPPYAVPAGVYVYTGFTPLPNDVLAVALGLAQRSYVPVIAALVAGNITLCYLVATFGRSLPFL